MQKKLKILIIDGSKFIRDYLLNLLQSFNFEVTTATCITDAARYISSNKFDFVITNYKLKEMNGVQFKNNYFKSANKKTKFILMFGFETQLITENTSDFLEILPKPINPKRILNALTKTSEMN